MAFSDIFGGAAQGAGMGSAFGPWGSVIGGVAGGLFGGITGSNREAQNRALARQREQYLNQMATNRMLQEKANYTNDARLNRLNADRETELSMLNDPSRIQAFMDPALEAKQRALANANTFAFGTQGKLLSSARMNALNNDQMTLANTSYDDAFKRWQAVENAQRGDINTNFNNRANIASNTFNNTMGLLQNDQDMAINMYNNVAPDATAPDLLGQLGTGFSAFNKGIASKGGFSSWMNGGQQPTYTLGNVPTANMKMMGLNPSLMNLR
jgi:hypothetical protein